MNPSAIRNPAVRRRAGRRAGRTPSLALVLVWLAPVIVLLVVYRTSHLSAEKAIAILLALAVAVLAAVRPDRALLGLIAALPFQGLILAKLWALGLPVAVAKDLGSWKEALAIGVVIAGVAQLARTRPRLDLFDRLALAFVALSVLYLLLQPEIIPSAPSAMSVRLLGFRETAGFVLLAFSARHAPLPPRFLRQAATVVLVVGAVVGGVAIYEILDPHGWNVFVVGTVEYTRYQIAVLGTRPLNMWNILTYTQLGGSQVVRAGSVFLSPGTCGFYLLLAFALGLERTTRGGRFSTALAPMLLIGAGLVVTETRAAIIGALLVGLLAFRTASGRRRHFRTQAAIALGIVALVAVPVAAGSGLVSRFGLLGNSSNVSTKGHETGLIKGFDVVVSNPLGQGLGTGAGTGQRFAVQASTIPENNYIEVGDELGILPMLVFAALTLALVAALRRAAMLRSEPLVSAAWAAAAGLAVGAWFLQTWTDFSVAWTLWGLAGAAVGIAARRPQRRTGREAPAATGRSVEPPSRVASAPALAGHAG